MVILHDHVDDGGNLVALELCVAELADAPLECVGILRNERGDLGRDHLAGDRIRLPRTVTSLTLSICSRTFSISVGCTFSPPTLISSDLRPRMRMYSPSLSTRSCVLNQPSASNGDGALR